MFKDFDVLLMPYSYLLSVKMRKVLGIQLEGNILILDEAHNCEDLAEQLESFELDHSKLPKELVKKLRLGMGKMQ